MAKNRTHKNKPKSKGKGKDKTKSTTTPKIIEDTPIINSISITITDDSELTQSEPSIADSASLASNAESDITSVSSATSMEPANAYPKMNLSFASDALEFPTPAPVVITPTVPSGEFTFNAGVPRKIAIPKSRVKNIFASVEEKKVEMGEKKVKMSLSALNAQDTVPEPELEKVEISASVEGDQGEEEKIESSISALNIQVTVPEPGVEKVEISTPVEVTQPKEGKVESYLSTPNTQDTHPEPDVNKATLSPEITNLRTSISAVSHRIEEITTRLETLSLSITSTEASNLQLNTEIASKAEKIEARLSKVEEISNTIDVSVQERVDSILVSASATVKKEDEEKTICNVMDKSFVELEENGVYGQVMFPQGVPDEGKSSRKECKERKHRVKGLLKVGRGGGGGFCSVM